MVVDGGFSGKDCGSSESNDSACVFDVDVFNVFDVLSNVLMINKVDLVDQG